MLRITRILPLLVAIALFHPAQSHARQVPHAVDRLFRISGSLGQGAATGPASVRFAIYDEALSGTLLWDETQVVTPDGAGTYTVLLGAGTPEGVPIEVFASGEARWLAVEVLGGSEAPRPRVLLTSVPYAVRAATAADAQALAGRPATDYQLTRAAREATASETSAPGAMDRIDEPQVNNGTANYLGKFTNNVDLVNSVMFENAGRIGIGTTTPTDVLHARFTDGSGVTTGLAVQNLSGAPNAYSGMLFYDQNGALGQFQGFNNTTHEYRINNIASGGSINFMLGTSVFRIRPDRDIELTGNVRDIGGNPWLAANWYGANTLLGKYGLGGGTAVPGSGSHNTAIGHSALSYLQGVNSQDNTALGSGALEVMAAGAQNTALGRNALAGLTQGTLNIGIGTSAGAFLVTGSQNLYIGSGGAGSENGTIRIGDWFNYYDRFFVGAVRGITTGGSDAVQVVIDGNGQLGTINSSRRYKDDIRDMGVASSGLMKLRPVTYRYKRPYADGSRPLDYGLIAEEVAEVYPELVAYRHDGEPETVQYHKLSAMLLNELQKQHSELQTQNRELESLRARLFALERALSGLTK